VNLAARQRLEITLFLVLAAVVHQDFHVADVGRLTVKGVMAQQAAAQPFAKMGELTERKAQAAVGFGEMGRPKSQGFDLIAFFLKLGSNGFWSLIEKVGFQGNERLVHKVIHLFEQQL